MRTLSHVIALSAFLFRFIVRFLACFLIAVLLYGLLVVTGTLIPVNRNFSPVKDGVSVYVKTNGFHTDLILPIEGKQEACFRVLAEEKIRNQFGNYSYASFGWGDRDFYLSSYQTAFPSTMTILDALFAPGQSLMHVSFLRNAPQTGADVKAVYLSAAQYNRLVSFISGSFRQTDQGLLRLDQPGYGDHDFFYEAEGHYHLFNTCNAWTGRALREAGVKVSWWTPLESSVFYHLP